MNHSDRLTAFVALGHRLNRLSDDEIIELAARARNQNNWFDEPNVRAALLGVAALLDEQSLRPWASRYRAEPEISRRVGVVMAGNIPLVGFHDLLCVLISGHQLLAKPSSEDKLLMTWVANELIKIEPRFAERLAFVERLNEADAFIATGSNNTARYFEYYFGKRPHLIRRNRTSLAILTGQESAEALAALGRDIFQYYGLGCRNVSKLYVPEGYRFDALLDALEPWHTVLHHNRYQNNYDYNKSILLVNSVPHYDNGFLLLTEATALVSPISVLHYGTYTSEVDLVDQLTDAAEQIQCIVSDGHQYAGSFAFGQAQSPTVSDYADGVDTMAFLAELS
ncbi:Acyl-CoA reductase (LuxC) [Hymenobacter daecheongensis DSM 21074]|uniref:Acyl-CoA reductase (LuxC) n=1 Tax=Hymenobacter daecheongensis DSM 21074 TaxID=1121955 RepID=A0A1M6E3B3_9BACT|nr:acyl-CoA reductase [Hymenobacter daecheongensis]SHI80034.1 Acyl-CoA reductase (LuxC) [Hymenobacter daecheongensis DSM 21074]